MTAMATRGREGRTQASGRIHTKYQGQTAGEARRNNRTAHPQTISNHAGSDSSEERPMVIALLASMSSAAKTNRKTKGRRANTSVERASAPVDPPIPEAMDLTTECRNEVGAARPAKRDRVDAPNVGSCV